MRQLVYEALVLGPVSIPLGVVLTDVGLTLITAGVPADDVPYLIKFRLDPTTLIYTVAVAAFSACSPASRPRGGLEDESGGGDARGRPDRQAAGARTRARYMLVVGEVVLALGALFGGVLPFMRSPLKLQGA